MFNVSEKTEGCFVRAVDRCRMLIATKNDNSVFIRL